MSIRLFLYTVKAQVNNIPSQLHNVNKLEHNRVRPLGLNSSNNYVLMYASLRPGEVLEF